MAEPDGMDVAPDRHVRIQPRPFEVRDIAVNLAKNTSWRVFPCTMPKKNAGNCEGKRRPRLP
jgi:hypothetical protein